MSTRIQKLQKIATESIILDILSKQQRVRWKELKQKSGLSSRTLSDRLKGLMDKNLVRRKVDPSTYPPATYYEINRTVDLSSIPDGEIYLIFKSFFDKKNRSAGLFAIIEKDNPRSVLENILKSIWHDFLFTLNFCLENYQYSKHIAVLYQTIFNIQLEQIMGYTLKNYKFAQQVNQIFNEYLESQKKILESMLSDVLLGFKDKELAKAVLILYYKEALLLDMELYIFLVQLSQSLELRRKLEKEFGQPIDEERLNNLIAEEGWKDIESFSAAVKRVTSS
ncbi:MAG: hypothetical protein QXV52_03945 [Nitrososphaeria archaeon]